jgi:flagellar hook-associated protein FlgK
MNSTNLGEEAANLIRHQQAWAAGKVLHTTARLFDTIPGSSG